MNDSYSEPKDQREKVNLGIQILLTVIIPFLAIYGFYKINKLVFGIIIVIGGFIASLSLQMLLPFPYGLVAGMITVYVIPLGFILKWSINWNRTISQSS